MTNTNFLESVRTVHGELGVRLVSWLFGLGEDVQEDEHLLDVPEYMNQTQVCAALNVSINKLKDMVADHEFPDPDIPKRGRDKLWSTVTVRAWQMRHQGVNGFVCKNAGAD
jgi:hypothetical protein